MARATMRPGRTGGPISTPARGRSYGMLLGVVAVLVFTGLAVPFLFGDPVPPAGPSLSAESPGLASGPLETGDAAVDGSTSDTSTGAGMDTTTGAARDTTTAAGGEGQVAGSGPGTPAGSAGPLTASDRGVTATHVRVGFTLVDLGPATQAGEAINFASPETQQSWWQGAVDEVNKTGGINGRQIQPVYQNVNVLDSAQAQAACVAMTEDKKVFAVVGVMYFPVADECVVIGHDTPLSTIGPNDDSVYRAGRLITLMPRTSRVIGQLGSELNRQGLLTGKHVGILGDAGSDPRGQAMRQLEGIVKAGKPASVRTSTLGSDLASAAAQTGLVVNNWRNAGVDTVIFIVNPSYGIAFVQNADRQFWKPQYYASDFANMGNSDVATLGMSEGFDGAVAFTTTTVGRTANAALRACVDTITRNGQRVDPTQAGLAGQQCDMFNAFVAGARAAGPTLTRDAFARGVQNVGSIPMWRIGGGSFGPGKFDFADLLATVQWEKDCDCWQARGGFRPSS